MAQADDNVSILDMYNASLNAEFEPDERLARQFCNEQEFPDQTLQLILGDTNLRRNEDGAKLKKQQFHAKLELERRKQERSNTWRQQVELLTCVGQNAPGQIALALLHSAECMLQRFPSGGLAMTLVACYRLMEIKKHMTRYSSGCC